MLLKKTLVPLVALSLLLSVFSGCKSKQNEAAIMDARGEEIFATASAPEDSYRSDPVNASNNSGINGSESFAVMHSVGTNADDCWLTKEDAGADNWIMFDFGEVKPVGKMYVWNFSQQRKEAAGVKDAKVLYSLDGANWTNVMGEDKTVRFAKTEYKEGTVKELDGGGQEFSATNLDGSNAPLDFNGVLARYVKIVPEQGNDKGNWGGFDKDGNGQMQERYGLSEVKFFKYKTDVQQGNVIVAKAKNPPEGKNYQNLVNGYGLSDYKSTSATHGNDPATMMLDSKSSFKSIVIDLDGNYPVKDILIFNYNEPGKTDAGMRKVTISTSVNNENYEKLGENDGAFEIPQADGSQALQPSLKIDAENRQIRYIKITAEQTDGNWGNDQEIGLSEIMFTYGTGYAAEPARDWTGMFSQYNGWIGGDGIYSAMLDGNERWHSATEKSELMFIFSDTFIGKTNEVDHRVGNLGMHNHTLAFLKGNRPIKANIEFVTEASDGSNIFENDTYWLSEIVVDAKNKKIYMPAFVAKGLSNVRDDIVVVDIKDGQPDLENYTVIKDLDFSLKAEDNDAGVNFGTFAGIMDYTKNSGAKDADGYLYIYGSRSSAADGDSMCVSRVKPDDFTNLAEYEYWNGSEWLKDKEAAMVNPGAALTNFKISGEVSVTPIDEGEYKGKFLLIFGTDMISHDVGYAIGDSPTGPFTDAVYFYRFDDSQILDMKNICSYSAKAHHQLSAKGEVLISKNFNTWGDEQFRVSPTGVHPWFLRLFNVKAAEK